VHLYVFVYFLCICINLYRDISKHTFKLHSRLIHDTVETRTLDPSVEADTLKNVVLHSAATALASIVWCGRSREERKERREKEGN
jgi:hypothetical protein